MESIKAMRNVKRQLEKYSVKSPSHTAQWLVEKYKRNDITEEDAETIEYINSIIPIADCDEYIMADAIMIGNSEIQKAYTYLCGCFGKEKTVEFYKKNNDLLLLTQDKIQNVNALFSRFGFTSDEINSVLIESVKLSYDDIEQRINIVLKYFNSKEFLIFLIQERMLFYPHYYVDVIDAIENLVAEVGVLIAKTILTKEEYFLYLWKRDEYRNDHMYRNQFKEALEIISKYKSYNYN